MSEQPRCAVRIGRGLVTHWRDVPLTTWELARECRDAIREYTGEEGRIEEVLLCAAIDDGHAEGDLA